MQWDSIFCRENCSDCGILIYLAISSGLQFFLDSLCLLLQLSATKFESYRAASPKGLLKSAAERAGDATLLRFLLDIRQAHSATPFLLYNIGPQQLPLLHFADLRGELHLAHGQFSTSFLGAVHKFRPDLVDLLDCGRLGLRQAFGGFAVDIM